MEATYAFSAGDWTVASTAPSCAQRASACAKLIMSPKTREKQVPWNSV